MINLFIRELKEIGSFSRRYYHEIVVIGVATLALTLYKYYPVSSAEWGDALVYFAALPLFAIVVLLRRNPLDFGLRPGNYRLWLFHVGVAVIVWIPILFISSRYSALQDYYTLEEFEPLQYLLETAAYMLGWEFLFRGFLLFGLKKRLGELSIIVQMIPFVLLHFGKPGLETISTIFTGIYFGYVAYRGNSAWPALIIHLVANVSFRAVVNL
jgi:hypothetical protein